MSSSAAGSIKVEILDADRGVISGYTREDCWDAIGDSLEHPVQWKHGYDVGKLSGTTIRLRFIMEDADLFSIRFLR